MKSNRAERAARLVEEHETILQMYASPSGWRLPKRIIEKDDAKARGFKRYFTGRLCRKGHLAERNMKGRCIECWRVKTPRNKEKQLAAQRKRYARMKASELALKLILNQQTGASNASDSIV